MREAYDCLVIGLGPAACVAAKTLAVSGRRVAMIPSELEEASAHDAWIIPAAPPEAIALERCGLGPMSFSCHVRPLQFATVVLDDPDADAVSSPPGVIGVTEFRQRCRAAIERDPHIALLAQRQFVRYAMHGERATGVVTSDEYDSATSRERVLAAPLIVDARAHRVRRLRGYEEGRYDAHFWGVYENVAGIADQRAWLYRGGQAEFWLLPCDQRGETIVGVSVRGQPASRIASGADLWEEELVRCPELAERLMDAHLSDLYPQEYCVYTQRTTPPAGGVVLLEDIACPAATAFRWNTLLNAARVANSLLAESAPSPTLSAGEG